MAIPGNNAAPVVIGPIAIPVSEDLGPATIAANANTYDPDLIDIARAVGIPTDLPPGISYDPMFGVFIIDTHHPALQSLAAGQTETFTVNYFITDGLDTVPHALVDLLPARIGLGSPRS